MAHGDVELLPEDALPLFYDNEETVIRKPRPGPPTRLGEFRIERELGRGGMGVVYAAVQEPLGRRVALKVLSFAAASSPAAVERFLREASLVAKLEHPHIVRIYAMGQAEGALYFAMELIEGDSLRARIARGPLAPREAVRVTLDIARALHHAHQAGVVHRDIKPANILLDAQGVPYLADFGLAHGEDSKSLTVSGDLLGTPMYMSPEQAGGKKEIGPPSDVYSLGAVLYEALTGLPPGDPDSDLIAQLHAALLVDVPPPSRENPRVPRDLDVIVGKCLHKDPARRYASAAALAEDLHRFLEGEAILARPPSIAHRLTRLVKRHRGVAIALATLASATTLVAGYWATRPGWLTLQVTPADASVRIDEGAPMPASRVGRLPLAEGLHSLRIERDGYAPLEMDYAIRRAEAAAVPVNLKRVRQRVTILTDPPECGLEFHGRDGSAFRLGSPTADGEAGFQGDEVDTGAYEVVVEKEGYARERLRLDVGREHPIATRVTLPPAALWKAKESQLSWFASTRVGSEAEPVLAVCSSEGEIEYLRGRDGASLAFVPPAGHFPEPLLIRREGEEAPFLLVIDRMEGDSRLFRFGGVDPVWPGRPTPLGPMGSRAAIRPATGDRGPEAWIAHEGEIGVVDLRTGELRPPIPIAKADLIFPIADAPPGWVVQRTDSIEALDVSGAKQGSLSTPPHDGETGALIDLFGDGRQEIVIGYSDGTIHAYRARPLEELWTIPSLHKGSPSLAVGVLRRGEPPSIVACEAGAILHAWDGKGKERWSWRLPANPAMWLFLADMDADGERDVVYASLDAVWVLGVRTGRVIAEVPIPHPRLQMAHPPRPHLAIADLDDDGLLDVVASTGDGTVQAIPGRRVVWSYAAEHAIRHAPALFDVDGDGTPDLVFTSLDSHVYALEGRTGRRLWYLSTDTQLATTPAVLGGDLIVAAWGGLTERVDGRTGRVAWSCRPQAKGWLENFQASPIAAEVDGRAVVLLASWREDAARVRGATGAVLCLDAASGEVRWTRDMPAPFSASPVLLGPRELVVADRGGRIACLDPADGTVLWTQEVEGQFAFDARWSPESSRGRALYWTASESGLVMELRAGQRGAKAAEGVARGAIPAWAKVGGKTLTIACGASEASATAEGASGPVWRWRPRATVVAAPLAVDLDGDGDDEVVIADVAGRVACLDGATGATRWTFEAGAGVEAWPIAADVDGNGLPEVVVATIDGRFAVLSGLGHRWSCEWSTRMGDHEWTNAPASVGPTR